MDKYVTASKRAGWETISLPRKHFKISKVFPLCTNEAYQATATSGIRPDSICVPSKIYYKIKQIMKRCVSKPTDLEKQQ